MWENRFSWAHFPRRCSLFFLPVFAWSSWEGFSLAWSAENVSESLQVEGAVWRQWNECVVSAGIASTNYEEGMTGLRRRSWKSRGWSQNWRVWSVGSKVEGTRCYWCVNDLNRTSRQRYGLYENMGVNTKIFGHRFQWHLQTAVRYECWGVWWGVGRSLHWVLMW